MPMSSVARVAQSAGPVVPCLQLPHQLWSSRRGDSSQGHSCSQRHGLPTTSTQHCRTVLPLRSLSQNLCSLLDSSAGL